MTTSHGLKSRQIILEHKWNPTILQELYTEFFYLYRTQSEIWWISIRSGIRTVFICTQIPGMTEFNGSLTQSGLKSQQNQIAGMGLAVIWSRIQTPIYSGSDILWESEQPIPASELHTESKQFREVKNLFKDALNNKFYRRCSWTWSKTIWCIKIDDQQSFEILPALIADKRRLRIVRCLKLCQNLTYRTLDFTAFNKVIEMQTIRLTLFTSMMIKYRQAVQRLAHTCQQGQENQKCGYCSVGHLYSNWWLVKASLRNTVWWPTLNVNINYSKSSIYSFGVFIPIGLGEILRRGYVELKLADWLNWMQPVRIKSEGGAYSGLGYWRYA